MEMARTAQPVHGKTNEKHQGTAHGSTAALGHFKARAAWMGQRDAVSERESPTHGIISLGGVKWMTAATHHRPGDALGWCIIVGDVAVVVRRNSQGRSRRAVGLGHCLIRAFSVYVVMQRPVSMHSVAGTPDMW